jgi:hypothetical protein
MGTVRAGAGGHGVRRTGGPLVRRQASGGGPDSLEDDPGDQAGV